MEAITTAAICVGGIGCASAAILAVADKFLSVKEDPRIGQVASCLPGANCGGCGFAGCADYAKAVVTKGAPLDKCSAGGPACVEAIAKILGREAGPAQERKAAMVFCHGYTDACGKRAGYNGIADCSAANSTGGGDKACSYGCLGYGSCARVCPVGAISFVKSVAKVDKTKCIACGKCVEACPRKLIRLVPVKETVHVFCSNKDRGPAVKKVCSNGCLGCTLCTKLAAGAFKMEGALAVRDYGTAVAAESPAIAKCPAHSICQED